MDLDRKNNLIFKKFIYRILSQDFQFNKLQLKINNCIYDASLTLKKNKKKTMEINKYIRLFQPSLGKEELVQ